MGTLNRFHDKGKPMTSRRQVCIEEIKKYGPGCTVEQIRAAMTRRGVEPIHDSRIRKLRKELVGGIGMGRKAPGAPEPLQKASNAQLVQFFTDNGGDGCYSKDMEALAQRGVTATKNQYYYVKRQYRKELVPVKPHPKNEDFVVLAKAAKELPRLVNGDKETAKELIDLF